MKIKAIDLVDLFNYSLQNIAYDYIDAAKFQSSRINVSYPHITGAMVRTAVEEHLNKLNRIGFNKNTTFLIIDGSNAACHMGVKHKDLAQCQGLAWSLIVDPDAREYFSELIGINIPTSLKISDEVEYIKRSEHTYVKFITFNVDFMSSVYALRNKCPIDVDIVEMKEIFETFNKAIDRSMIISNYEFYNRVYGQAIDIELSLSQTAFLDTNADRVISTIMN